MRRINTNTFKPWVLFTKSVDCDGRRVGCHTYHWTKRSLRRELEAQEMWADGAVYGSAAINHTKRFRDSLADLCYWNDDTDRYAEHAGY